MTKLDVSSGAGGPVAVRRNRFDQHLNDCPQCQTGARLCDTAETLWRRVCLAAMRARQADAVLASERPRAGA